MPATTRDVDNYVASMNSIKRKNIPTFLDGRFPPVLVYNIYTMKHGPIWGLPGGPYHIPACEEGKPFSRPCVVKGIIHEEYSLSDGQGNMSYNDWEGIDVAEADVVGKKSYTPGNTTLSTNLMWKGVFACKDPQKCPTCEGNEALKADCDTCYGFGTIPSAAELAEARNLLEQHMKMWLADGDAVSSANDPKNPVQPMHRAAALFLKQNRAWSTAVRAMQECPGCGEPVKPNIAKCGHCGAILDRKKAIELGLLPPESQPVPVQAGRR